MTIVWTLRAKKRLERIYHFYESKSVKVAQRIIADIHAAVRQLANFPQIAATESALREEALTYRSLLVRNLFKIIYYFDEAKNEVLIITIWDCRQDPERLTGEIKK
jgi:plasmid stabilization system protein ParE